MLKREKIQLDTEKIPESDVIIRYIVDRFKKGRYTLIALIGDPGSGKTSAGLRLKQLVDEKIHGESKLSKDSISTSQVDFFKFVHESKPGDSEVIDEIGVLFPSRRSMSSGNLDAAHVLDTCRKKKLIIFSNAPMYKGIDLSIRGHVRIIIETLKINKKKKIIIFKALKVRTNPLSGKPYYRNFTRGGFDIKRFYVKFVDGKIWEDYENRKDDFMANLYKKAKLQAIKKEEKFLKEIGMRSNIKVNKPLSKRELEAHQLVNINGITQIQAAKDMGVSGARVNKLLKQVKEKCKLETQK